jgi:hypothetical protein
MAVNDKIFKADYNNIRNKVVGVLGVTTSGNSGYGQPVRSAAVSESDKVTINEWGNLYYDIVNCYVHQTGAAPGSPSSAVENATIAYRSTQPNYQYDDYANVIVANKFTVAGSQSFTTAYGTTSQTWPGIYGSYWNTLIQCTITATWPTAAAARYFFNSGGEIRFSSSLTGSTANDQTIGWSSLLTAAGTKAFGGNKPGTGTSPSDNTNFYRLTNAYSIWTSSTGSGAYTSNIWRIQARSNVLNNTAGGATQIEFLVQWVDGYIDYDIGRSGPGQFTPPGDEVYGTINLSVSTLAAIGTLVPSGAGAFAVTQPTITLGGIAP